MECDRTGHPQGASLLVRGGEEEILGTTMSYFVVFCSLFASNLRFITVPGNVYAERGENLLCPIYFSCSLVEMLY